MSPVVRPTRHSIVCEAAPNKKADSAAKRARQAEKRRVYNKARKSEVKTRMKKLKIDADFLYFLADAAVIAFQYGNPDTLCSPLVEAKTNGQDLVIFNKNESLQKSPLYIVAESYGGKFAATLGLSALKAIESGKLKLILGGVALGDSWISPEDFVFSWGPLLKDVSRLDSNGAQKSNRKQFSSANEAANRQWPIRRRHKLMECT